MPLQKKTQTRWWTKLQNAAERRLRSRRTYRKRQRSNASIYSGTKAAVDAVTRTLAKELGPRNIRVNAINPGMVETEGVRAAGFTESDFRKQTEAQTPLGRIGQTQDIAPAAVFLASSDSSWITGETLHISGGNR